MQISEKELEDFIFDSLYHEYGADLVRRGLVLPFQKIAERYKHMPRIKWFRQLDISPYGIIDIVGVYRFAGKIYIDLYELKANPIECRDIDQIFRYKKGIEVFIRNSRPWIDYHINSVLIGNGYNTGNYIQNELPFLTVSEYNYSLHGMNFISHNDSSWCVKGDENCHIRNIKGLLSVSKSKPTSSAEKIHGY